MLFRSHRAEVDAAVRAWTATLDKLAAMRALGDAGVPGGALRSTSEVYLDADLRERGIFVTVDDPGKGEVTLPGYPVKMSRSPARVTAPPQPGQHTAEVLRDWLGEDPAALGLPGPDLTGPGLTGPGLIEGER